MARPSNTAPTLTRPVLAHCTSPARRRWHGRREDLPTGRTPELLQLIAHRRQQRIAIEPHLNRPAVTDTSSRAHRPDTARPRPARHGGIPPSAPRDTRRPRAAHAQADVASPSFDAARTRVALPVIPSAARSSRLHSHCWKSRPTSGGSRFFGFSPKHQRLDALETQLRFP